MVVLIHRYNLLTYYLIYCTYLLHVLYIFQEISGRIMEERERLSLGTRSRATSGTSSPVPSNSTRSKAHPCHINQCNCVTHLLEHSYRPKIAAETILPRLLVDWFFPPRTAYGCRCSFQSEKNPCIVKIKTFKIVVQYQPVS